MEKASKLEYDRFYETNNAFLKLSQAFEIVSFLEELATAKNKDTEKIVITTLVSLAEAVYRINKPEETIVENLVKGFFGPVKDMLEYRIR